MSQEWREVPIIAILAAILFPVFAKAREKARQTSCLSNMKQLTIACTQYVQDYDERMPMYAPSTYAYNWYHVLVPYVKNDDVRKCPSDTDRYIGYGVNYPHISWVGGATPLAKVTRPAEIACLFETEGETSAGVKANLYLAYCPQNYAPGSISWAVQNGIPTGGRHNEGINLGYIDGHAKWV